ncbi:glycosyltransferase family 4 protein [Blautia wexlerae]|uniref:glycosyltransferase family 4 protein n=1 Tax=Blautia wexlerae TaxID=418240 RepID=UPI0034A36E50
MRLVYLVQYFFPEKASGLQLVEDLLEGFSEHGWQTDVFTPTPTRGVTSEQRREYTHKRIEIKYDGNLTIHRMHLYREGKGFIGRAIRYILFSVECFWKAATVPADFIFTGSGPPTQGVVVGLAKKVSGKKVIYNLQDIFPDSLVTSGICSEGSFLMKMGHAMENFTYRNADHIITITDDMKNNIIKKGVPEDKITVVRNWIDTDKVKHISRLENSLFDELKLPRDKFYVVYAGNLGKVQGIEVILKAADLLRENKSIQFLIFGNGSEEENLKKLVVEYRLENISMYPLQPVDRVSDVYSMADVCVISCKPGTGGSGMPSKTWTIMAAGVPIVASFDMPSEMQRTIIEAKCGFCTKAGNGEELYKRVIQLYEDNKLKESFAENARRYAEGNVSKKKAVAEYIQAIECTINKEKKS